MSVFLGFIKADLMVHPSPPDPDYIIDGSGKIRVTLLIRIIGYRTLQVESPVMNTNNLGGWGL